MSINGSAFQTIASFPYTFTGLNAGAYAIEIRDANNCGETENITIEPELLISAVALTQPTCATNDGVIEFTVIGGSGPSQQNCCARTLPLQQSHRPETNSSECLSGTLSYALRIIRWAHPTVQPMRLSLWKNPLRLPYWRPIRPM